MTDNDIITYFFYYRNYERLNHKKLINIPKEYNEYLLNKYNDSDSILETIVRIRKHIDIKPICPICGQPLKFTNIVSKPFNKSCKNCENKQKTNTLKQTMLLKYHVENISQLDHIKQKKEQTCLKHYGVKYPMQSNKISKKIHQTKVIKYGNGNNNDKILLTKEKRYGNKYYFGFNTTEFKNNLIRKYGVNNISNLNSIKEKISKKLTSEESKLKTYNTKRKNNTFNTSKPEEDTYLLLKEKYSDVIRQYRSDLYPFNCDFYIPSKDLYIECNYTWTHGRKPYEGTEEDNIKLNKWKEKNTKYYNNAIYTWTDLDIRKRNIAKENNLNYLEVWNINELQKYINKKE